MGMRAVVTVSFRPPSSPRAARGRARPRRGPAGPTNGAPGRAPDRPARERRAASDPVERLQDGLGEGFRLPRRDEPPALALAQEVRRPAHAGRHDRPRRRQRLDERDRRPLVARGVHHHVEVAVDRGEVAPPAEERHLPVEAQLAAERLERGPLLAVPHEREAGVGLALPDDPRGPQEGGHVLDRHEAAHHPHERRRLRGSPPRPAARPAAAGRRGGASSRPSGTTRIFSAARDAEAHEVLLHRLRHRHERVRGGGEPRLEPAEEGRLRGREVPAQHVAVEGVNDGGNARRTRGEPAEEPGLGGVGVDDVRPPRPHEAVEPHERAQVLKAARSRDRARPSPHKSRSSPPRARACCPRAATPSPRPAASRSPGDEDRRSGGSRERTDPRCSGGRRSGGRAALLPFRHLRRQSFIPGHTSTGRREGSTRPQARQTKL